MAGVKPGTRALSIDELSAAQVERLRYILWTDVEKPAGDDGCWIPTTYRLKKGYGTVSWDGRKRLAHRASYALLHGCTPGDRLVRHTCDNPQCSNPHHMVLGTGADNSADMLERGRGRWRDKSSEEDVLRIREIYALGKHTCAQLAEVFGLSSQTVSHIVAGRTWARLHGGTRVVPAGPRRGLDRRFRVTQASTVSPPRAG